MAEKYSRVKHRLFDAAWKWLARQGELDDQGGAQYRRMKAAWVSGGECTDVLYWLLEAIAHDDAELRSATFLSPGELDAKIKGTANGAEGDT